VRRSDRLSVALILGLSFSLWAPRLRGPIDLRYDAGVYYITGLSLAEGRGYRLLNEPGEIHAIQYPPLLPAFVALHIRALGTADPVVVGQALRISFAALFTSYLLATYALARQYLGPTAALLVAMITALYIHTIHLSDLLFAEIPFALLTVLFVLVQRRGPGWRTAVTAGLLGAAAYLTRAAGIALLAAWVFEALIRRRWGQVAARAGLALVPIVAWQVYTGGVKSGREYAHPAYPYQRADYMYSNVGYVENILLVDPFVPEEGRVTPRGLAARVTSNLVNMPAYVGRVFVGGTGLDRSLSGGDRPRGGWRRLALRGLHLAQLAAGCIVLASLGLFVVRRDWLIPFYVAASLVLIASTPWPAQVNRYLTPILPFLALSIVLPLARLAGASARSGRDGIRRWGVGILTLVVAMFLGRNLLLVVRTFAFLHTPTFGAAPGGGHRLLYYGADWARFDEALAWLRERGEPDEIVATTAPHSVYLVTGLKAVMMPLEADTAKAQELLDAVPVDYLILDSLSVLDISRRYGSPVVQKYPALWEPVYTGPGGTTTIFQRSVSVGPMPRSNAPPAIRRGRKMMELSPNNHRAAARSSSTAYCAIP
jgi:hypothetical protein